MAGRRTSVALAGLALGVLSTPAFAQLEGYPHLDNDTIGLFRAVAVAGSGPAGEWDDQQWGVSLIDALAGGDAMSPLRYMIAFSAYGVAQAAMHTPAYREPYRLALDGFIRKMLHAKAWKDWLEVWGGVTPLGPDNIMYTGHLALMMALQRQLFDDRTYDYPTPLTGLEGVDFEVDLGSLSAFIATQAEAYLDGAQENTLNIPCEPGRIYVPCNTPHRLSQVLVDAMTGTEYAATNPAWLAWVGQRMTHPEHGVLYDLFWPFGPWKPAPDGETDVPVVEDRISGLYNGWTLWFLEALDPPWAAELYSAWRDTFVVTGADSPHDDGRTTVLDRSSNDDLVALVFNVGATGFGLVVSRLYDPPLYDKLSTTWALQFGAPEWSEDGARLTFAGTLFPRLIQNGFPLLGRTSTVHGSLRAIAERGWDTAVFANPTLTDVTPSEVFVNQAIWDVAKERLVLTVNGGSAVSSPAELRIANLTGLSREGFEWAVTRDGAAYDSVSWDGATFVITTAPLGPTLETYEVFLQAVPEPPPEPPEPPPSAPETPAPEDAVPEVQPEAEPGPESAPPADGSSGCGISPAAGPPSAWFGVLGILLLMVVRRRWRGVRSDVVT